LDLLIKSYLEIRKKLPQLTREQWKSTMNLGAIRGGKAPNIVPPYAEMDLDIRYNENYNVDELQSLVKKCIKDKRVKIKVLEKDSMLVNDANDKNILAFIRSFKKTTKKAPKIRKEHGASDGRFFSSKKIPCIVFGPKGENIHARNEYLDIDSAVKCYEILDDYVQALD
jgi:succinyl-diaminopimelate desuccinylase